MVQKTSQVRISMPKWMADYIYEQHRKRGYQYHSWMVVDMIVDAMKLPKWKGNPDESISKDMEEYVEIGKISRDVGEAQFAIAGARDDFLREIEGYKKAREAGWLTNEQFDMLVDISEKRHRRTLAIKVGQIERKEKEKKKREKKRKRHHTKEEWAEIKMKIALEKKQSKIR